MKLAFPFVKCEVYGHFCSSHSAFVEAVTSLFDHVGAGKQQWRLRKPERPGGFQIDRCRLCVARSASGQ
jgi:hypothetical protein